MRTDVPNETVEHVMLHCATLEGEREIIREIIQSQFEKVSMENSGQEAESIDVALVDAILDTDDPRILQFMDAAAALLRPYLRVG